MSVNFSWRKSNWGKLCHLSRVEKLTSYHWWGGREVSWLFSSHFSTPYKKFLQNVEQLTLIYIFLSRGNNNKRAFIRNSIQLELTLRHSLEFGGEFLSIFRAFRAFEIGTFWSFFGSIFSLLDLYQFLCKKSDFPTNFQMKNL